MGGLSPISVGQNLPELGGKAYIRKAIGPGEEGSDLFIGITGDATANAGHKELQVGMAVCEPDELLDILCDLIQRESHGRNGVAGALESDALSVDGPETLPSKAGGATVMMTG
jgi:hypothetical protein